MVSHYCTKGEQALDNAEIGGHFDSVACDHCEEYRKNGLSQSSTRLIEYLAADGLVGRTLLDLGCGTGRFSVEALKRGAKSSIGIDLSEKMVEIARELARENGFAEKTQFGVSDAANQDHPTSDIVILDKVICCYPQLEPLLSKSSAACRRDLGIVVPRDVGIAKVPIRVGVGLDNLISWAQRDPSRMYLHSLRLVDRILRQDGFTPGPKSAVGFWLVMLYRRTSPTAVG